MKKLSFLLISTILLVALTTDKGSALIPKVCLSNATVPDGVCCPVHKRNGQICGGHKYGRCGKINIYREPIPDIYRDDDRVHWPQKFFQYVCHCKKNYFGLACDECWYNSKGHDCQERRNVKRKSIVTLNNAERKLFLDVVDESRRIDSDYAVLIEDVNKWSDPLRQPLYVTASVQYYLTALHRFASRSTMFVDDFLCNRYGILDFNHDGCGFPTWHRYFMVVWERELEKIAALFGAKEFALPYWDWEGQTTCDICHNDLVGGEGEEEADGVRIHRDSVFSDWTEFCSEPDEEQRCYGCHKKSEFGLITRKWNSFDFPRTDDINFMLEQKTYCSTTDRTEDTENKVCNTFQRVFEGYCSYEGREDTQMYIHNKVHNMIDGSMCCSASATNDPIFMLHHIQTDRLFASWMVYQNDYRHAKLTPNVIPNEGVVPGHCRECTMTGFLPYLTHREVFTNTEDLGYHYDRLRLYQHSDRNRH